TEIRLQLFELRAEPDRIGEVETSVIINGPVAVFADAFANLAALLDGSAHRGVRVEDAAGTIGDGGAQRAEAGFDTGMRGLFQVAFAREAGGVAFDMVMSEAAKQFIDRHAEGFALDVPQRHIESAERMQLLAAGRIEVAAVHELPQVVDSRRVFADQHRTALGDSVLGAAFAHAGDALVGLDGDDVLALVEEFLFVVRIAVIAHSRDL